jgi:hypothetical protein
MWTFVIVFAALLVMMLVVLVVEAYLGDEGDE